jgi:hypothetical protein
VSRWCCIVPKVGKVQTGWIEILAMPSVVFDVFSAMATLRNWKAKPIESLRNAFREIEQSIMRRIELVSPWKRSLHGQGNPMPEGHLPFFQMSSQMVSPLRKDINENCSSWLYQADELIDQRKAHF